MPAEFRLTIITPDGVFVDERVTLVVLPAARGELGIMRGHEDLLAALYPGELRYTGRDGLRACFISNGYAHVTGQLSAVVCNAAEWPEDIDVARAEAGIERAKARLEDPASSPHMRDMAEQALLRQSKRIEVVKKFEARREEN